MGNPILDIVSIEALDPGGTDVDVFWSDGYRSAFHFIWLRDNCRCEACGTPEDGRRRSRLTAIPAELAVDTWEIEGGRAVVVHWSDDHCSRFESDWLRSHAYDDLARRKRYFQPAPWDDKRRQSPPSLDFGSVMSDPAIFHRALVKIRDHGLCFLTDAPDEPGTVEKLARRIGPPQESNFGRIQDIEVDYTRRSVASRTHELKPHTDEPYRASPPGILLFHCLKSDVRGGGASLFMDGFELAETLRRECPEGFQAIAAHRLPWRRHYEDDVDLSAAFPVIALDEFGQVAGVRINDRVAAPLSIPPRAVESFYRGLRRLLELAEDESLMHHRVLSPGDIAVFDNHRILHGRTELDVHGRRRLQWAQVERGDFFSRLRISSQRLGLAAHAAMPPRGAY